MRNFLAGLILGQYARHLLPSFDSDAAADSKTLSILIPPENQGERHLLMESQRNILDAALALGAISKDKRRPQDDIARKAGIVPHSGNTGTAFSELIRRGFLAAKTGRRGGTWLTDEGRAIAR